MKIMIVVGARPNFMKAAPIISAIAAHNKNALADRDGSETQAIQCVLVHTGQHYDQLMSDQFFIDLQLPRPDIHLGVGSGSHASQTAEIMKRFEKVLESEKPDVLLVVGDVNSTLACALVAAKISFEATGSRPLIAHVEAGLRSYDPAMPEEINRILTDHVADLLFVTEESGVRNLRQEGIADKKIHFVGNTMIDSLLAFKDKAEGSSILDTLALRRAGQHGSINGVARYALLTLHRPSNVDNRITLLSVLEGLEELSHSCPVIFPAHPRTQKRIAEFGLEHFFAFQKADGGLDRTAAASGIRLVAPLGYLDFLCLMKHASLVITDSGGIQEETTCLGVSCVTVRENTERPVTVTCGTNTIAGTCKMGIRNAIRRQMETKPMAGMPEKWDGMAGERIVGILARMFQAEHRSAEELALTTQH